MRSRQFKTTITLCIFISVILCNVSGTFARSELVSTSPIHGNRSAFAQTSSFVMPKIIGLTFDDASSRIDNLGGFLDYVDVLEGRSVWDDSNWKVVKQIPAAGTKVFSSDKFCAGVTQLSESWRTPKHFGCWESLNQTVSPLSLSSDSMYMKIKFFNNRSIPVQYRATVNVDTDDGDNLKVMFCTENSVRGRTFASRMRLSGKYYANDAATFYSYRGKIHWSISKFERQLAKSPC